MEQAENPVKDGTSKVKELFLDTKGACFLCLKDPSTLPEVTGQNKMTEVCLRKVCRYLNIDPCSILLKSLKGRLVNEEDDEEIQQASHQGTPCDFSVMLCVTCGTLIGNLTERIYNFEMLKMLIQHNLENLNRILTEAVKEGTEHHSRWKELKEKMALSSVEALLVEHLRHETRKKSSVKVIRLLAASLPKVKLRRMKRKLKGPASTSAENQIKEQQSETQSKPIATDSSSSVQPNKDALEAIGKNEKKDCNSHILEMCKKLQLFKKIRVRSQIYMQCSMCRQRLKSNPSTHFSDHIIKFHPEKLFIHLNANDSLMEDGFRKLCIEILTVEVDYAARPKKTKYTTPSSFWCALCKESYPTMTDYKYHFIVKHFQILEYKILRSLEQRGPPKNTIKQCANLSQGKETRSGTSGGVKCSISAPHNSESNENTEKSLTHAGTRSSNAPNCIMPLRRVSNRRKFKKTKSGLMMTCKICKNYYDPRSLQLHLITVHPEQRFIQSKLDQLSDQEFLECFRSILEAEESRAIIKTKKTLGKTRKVICPVCNHSLTQMQNFRYHIVVQHHSILMEKLMKAQVEMSNKLGKASEYEAAITDAAVNSKQAESTSKSESDNRIISPGKNHSKIKCPTCATVVYNTQLRRHIITAHPEQKFKEFKLDQLSDQQFQECFRNLIKLEENSASIKTKRLGKTKNIMCSLCDASFTRKCNFKKHLIVLHYGILKEKLTRAQVDMSTKLGIPQAKVVGKKGKCPICEKFYSNFHLPSHVSIAHPDHKLQEHKLDQLSKDDFKKCCFMTLDSVIKTAASKSKKELGETKEIICTFCHQKVRHKQHLKYHLVSCHYNVLVNKVIEMQHDWISGKGQQNVQGESWITNSVESVVMNDPLSTTMDETMEDAVSINSLNSVANPDYYGGDICVIDNSNHHSEKEIPKTEFVSFVNVESAQFGNETINQNNIIFNLLPPAQPLSQSGEVSLSWGRNEIDNVTDFNIPNEISLEHESYEITVEHTSLDFDTKINSVK